MSLLDNANNQDTSINPRPLVDQALQESATQQVTQPVIKKSKKPFVIVATLAGLLVAWFLFRYIMLLVGPPVSDPTRTFSNKCFTISVPKGTPKGVKIVGNAESNNCSFGIVSDTGGDAPVGIGEVFSGTQNLTELKKITDEGFAGGYELNLSGLGLLATGKGDPVNNIVLHSINVDGQEGVIYKHDSRRSISGRANTVLVKTPSELKVGGQPSSALMIWGASNKANGKILENSLMTLKWKI